ncbi:AcrR family transcriptional regulator [Conyzicola nivalis]|uniref:AcrR family transcriptional regulator n=1 Tax=Conyzicola nivalis TaxID=1477021 RepID=A0ABV2QL60_9MICO
MAKQARSLITRETILRAAGSVFAELSYSAATLGDVVTEAGVTQGSLYFHFDSKHQLASEVIQRQHETALAAVSSVAPGTRAVESLVRLSVTIAEQILTDPIVRGGMRLSTETPELFPGVARRPYQDWITTGTALLTEAAAQGDVAADRDLVALARFVMSAYTGSQVVSHALTGWADLYDRLGEMWEFVLPTLLVEDRRGDIPSLVALVPASD